MYIAQASSEHSICFATKSVSTIAAKIAVEEAFFYELKQGLVTRVRVIEDCSIIAAVGESMSNMPGVSGIFFGALGDARINVLSISQGCLSVFLKIIKYRFSFYIFGHSISFIHNKK